MTYFNDHDRENCDSLASEISELPNLARLRFRPVVTNHDANSQTVAKFNVPSSVPKLFFLDPFGYKKISASLLTESLAGWGTECIFFFNYARVIAALSNPAMEQHMIRLFGDAALEQLRTAIDSSSDAIAREQIVLSFLEAALERAGAKHVLTFAFKVERGQRSTHHLVFATKHPKGYTLMKEIMAGEGSEDQFGVPELTFTRRSGTGFLFQANPLEQLQSDLLHLFAGQTLSFSEIYEHHSIGKNFVPANYRAVLLKMESQGLVTGSPPASLRKQGTLGAGTMISFPQEKP